MTTRAAKLTVTANDQSRLFGQANPPLDYTITGFVGGEASRGRLRHRRVHDDATPSSPAGDYPITCTVGTLSAAGYSLRDVRCRHAHGHLLAPVPDRHARRAADGGGRAGGLHRRRRHPDRARDGEAGRLARRRGRQDHRAARPRPARTAVRICGATITGPLTISGSTGLVLVGGARACDGNTIVGPVRVTGNTGGVEFNGNTVDRPAADHRQTPRARCMRPATRSAGRSRSSHNGWSTTETGRPAQRASRRACKRRKRAVPPAPLGMSQHAARRSRSSAYRCGIARNGRRAKATAALALAQGGPVDASETLGVDQLGCKSRLVALQSTL